MFELTKHEETLLISVLHLKENAYGVHIREKTGEISGQLLNYGTLYRILDQLVRKGFLERKEGIPLPEKGGRRKIYYKLSKKGVEVLRKSLEVQNVLWGESTRTALKKAE